VAEIGYQLGFDPVEVVAVTVGAEGGPEAAARSARHRELAAVATALDADVLLGHTLDDQAETVLLGLGRGSGPRSVAGMLPRRGRFVRPLLGVRRATTTAACAALGLDPWHDPQNADPAYTRVRLRREVLPLLEDVLQGGVAEALARTAALLRADLDYLDQLAAAARIDAADADVATLLELAPPVRTRVLRCWAESRGAGGLTARHVDALDALITRWRGQGPVDLPGSVRVGRVSGRLILNPTTPPSGPFVRE
jgi:tRNA(Ile)-lysidine synthase